MIVAIMFGINRLDRARRNRELAEQQQRFRERYNGLMEKYHSAEIVEKIMRGEFWEGMTKDMLLDARGEPIDTDEQVFKSKVRETLKYGRMGRNRYGLRITLENDVVIGWRQSNQL